ncbi:MAG: hypothetical protein WC552_08490 [Candidatus Omnitrophota bacterium]
MPTQEELTDLGIEAYEKSEPTRCLEYLQQAIDLYPEDYAARLNYGSFAYQIALDIKRQGVGGEQGEMLLKHLASAAMDALSRAIELAKKSSKEDGEAAYSVIGQAAFLTGDMWHYLFDKPQLAWDHFMFSKKYWPDNPNLMREMRIVRQKIPNDYVAQPMNLYDVNTITGEMAIIEENIR